MSADPVRNRDRRALQHHLPLVERQAVETRPVLGGEGFEPVERALLLEHRRIGFEREGRVEDAGAAAGRFLGLDRVRGAVGAEEEFRRARGGGAADRQPVPLALRHRQAISMRAQAAVEDARCG